MHASFSPRFSPSSPKDLPPPAGAPLRGVDGQKIRSTFDVTRGAVAGTVAALLTYCAEAVTGPEIAMFAGLNVSCAGNCPVSLQVVAPTPPTDCKVALYCVPTIATGNSTVMMDSDAAAVVCPVLAPPATAMVFTAAVGSV